MKIFIYPLQIQSHFKISYKKIIQVIGCCLMITMFFTAPLKAQLTGVKTIPGTYASISAAITDLNAQGVGSGGVTFDVAAGYTETAANLTITATGTLSNPIVFEKSGIGADPLITAGTGTSTTVDGIIKLSGTDFITFDAIDLRDTNTVSATNEMEWGYALCIASNVNGCQNVIIKNCTITLNRNYVSSKGIFSGNNTTALITPVTTITTSPGTNSLNQFFNNSISNVYYGVFLLGNVNGAANDSLNQIGVAGANNISSFGGFATTPTATYGVYCGSQKGITVANNIINGTGSGITTAACNGIRVEFGTNFNVDIFNNTVTMTGTNTTGNATGIYNNTGITGTTNTVNIYGNTIQNFSFPSATTANIFGIKDSANAFNKNIYNNIIQNCSNTSTTLLAPGVGGIYNTGNSSGSVNIYGNKVTNFVVSGATFTTQKVYMILNAAQAANQLNIYNNVIRNDSTKNTLASTITSVDIAGIANEASTTSGIINIYGDTIQNCGFLNGSTGEVVNLIENTNTATTINIKNNFVSGNTIANTTGNCNGILNSGGTVAAGTSLNIDSNLVQNNSYTTATTGNVFMIQNSASVALANIFNNLVQNNSSTATTTSGTGHGGIFNSNVSIASTNINIYNNTVKNHIVSGGITTMPVYMIINLNPASSQLNIYNNAVRNDSIKSTGSVTSADIAGIANKASLSSSGTINIYGDTIESCGFMNGTSATMNMLENTNGSTVSTNIHDNVLRNNTYIQTVSGAIANGISNSGTSLSVNILNNTISSNSSSITTGSANAITQTMAVFAQITNVNISSNTIQGMTYPNATTGTINMILNAGVGGSTAGSQVNIFSNNILSNTIGTNGAGTANGISNTGGTAGITQVNIYNNNLKNFSFPNSVSLTSSMIVNSGPLLQLNIYSDSLLNNTYSGVMTSANIQGIYSNTGPTSPAVVSIYNNFIKGFSAPAATTATIHMIRNAAVAGKLSIHDNTIQNNTRQSTATAAAVIYGILNSAAVATDSTAIFRNTIDTLIASNSGAASGGAIGINNTAATANAYIFKNRIYRVTSTGTASSTFTLVTGINITAGTNVNIYNNYVSDLNAPSSSLATALSGMQIGGGTNVNIYYNTVYLNGTYTGLATAYGSSAIYLSVTTATVDMRNNIFENTSAAGSAGGASATVALRRSATALTGYSTLSNNNSYYGAASNNQTSGIYYDGTNLYSTIPAFKTQVSGRESLAFSELSPFISTSTNNLHLNTSTPTLCESDAQPVSSPITVSDDFDGDARNGTSPDVGADEGNFTQALPCGAYPNFPQNGSSGLCTCSGLLSLRWYPFSLVNVSPNVTMTGGYNLYLGTNNPPAFYTNLTDTFFSIPTNLLPNTTYYWQIKVVTNQGETPGCTIFSFSTGSNTLLSSSGNTRCGSGTVTLNATGGTTALDTIKWYDSQTGGNLLATGSIYTPFVTATTPYYVGVGKIINDSIPPFTVGTSLTLSGNATMGAQFDVYVPVVLNSFHYKNQQVMNNCAVNLSDANNNLLYTLPISSLPTGEQIITFPGGWTVQPGIGYKLELTLTAWWTPATITYPTILSGRMAVTGTPTGDRTNAFFDWQVSSNCETARQLVLANVTPAPSVTIIPTGNTHYCAGTDSTILTASSPDTNYTFTWAPAAGLNTTSGTTVTASPSVTTTYTLTGVDGQCSNITIFTITIDNAVTGVVTATPQFVCQGGFTTLTTSGSNGSLQWQSWNGSTWINTSATDTLSALTVSVSQNTIYRVQASNLVCAPAFSNPDTVYIPSLDSVHKLDTICGQGAVHMQAYGAGTINWYTGASGGVSINTGGTFSPSIFSDSTFYVSSSALIGPCTVGRSSITTGSQSNDSTTGLKFNTVNSAVINQVSMFVGCGSCTILFGTPPKITFTLTDSANNILRQTTITTGGTFGTGQEDKFTLNFPVPPGNGYKLLATMNTGTSTQIYGRGLTASFPYTDPCDPGFQIVSNDDGTTSSYNFICNWKVSTLCEISPRTIVHANYLPAVDITVTPPSQHFCDVSNGAVGLSASSLDPNYNYTWSPSAGLNTTAGSSVTATVSTSTIYTVTAVDGNCSISKSVPVTLSVSPTVSATSPSTICQFSNPITLNAYGGTNGAYQVGTSTTTDTVPFTSKYRSTRTQFIYTKAELNAAGITGAGLIKSLGFIVSTKASTAPFTNFSIKLANAGVVVLNNTFINSGLTTVYTSASYSTVAGNNDFTLTSPFSWNGTSNLLVDICFDNAATQAASDVISAYSTIINQRVSVTGISQCSATAANATALSKAILRLTFSPAANYSWSPSTNLSNASISNPVFTPAVSGSQTYTVTVTDAFTGCTASTTLTINVNQAPTASATNTGPVCGGNNLTLNSTTDVGTSFAWTGPNGFSSTLQNPTITGITTAATGTYTVIITSPNGCTNRATTVVSVNGNSGITPTVSNVTCRGGSNGSITLSITSGSPPFSYLWSTGATTRDISGLTAGIYTITVTDSLGCTPSLAVNVTEPGVLAALCSGTAVSCNGAGNGTATIAASNGTAPYHYNWNTGATTTSIINLAPAPYSVTVTDNCGTTASCSFTVTEPAVLVANCGGTNVTCIGGTNGSAAVTGSGGTTPYAYLWSTGGTTSSLLNRGAGTYSVTITDSRGCRASCSYTVLQPSPLGVTCGGTSITCNGAHNGTASVTPSGGTPAFQYRWSNGGTTSGISNLAAGPYVVTVTDLCNAVATCSYEVFEPSALSLSTANNSTVCSGDSLKITSNTSGGTPPYSYSWIGPNAYTSTAANPVIVPSATNNSGTYSLTVTDHNGCTITSSTTATVINCVTLLHVNMMIEGYYIGSSLMNTAMANEGVAGATGTQCDTVTVEVRDTAAGHALIAFDKPVLNTDGSVTATLPPSLSGGTYYIAIHHRNAIWTWSAAPVLFSPVTSYSFITARTQAYGGNQTLVDVGIWAFYNGDTNQDQNIDLIDFPALDFGINHGLFGYYATDLNGDGNVDLLDFPVLDANINAGVFAQHP